MFKQKIFLSSVKRGKMQNIKLRKISELMENYSPVYPDDKRWESTIEYLLHEPAERETVVKLIEELKRDGTFREPILAIEDTETGKKYIGDGTHRLVAAYIAQHDTILTADSYYNDYPENQSFITLIGSEIKLDEKDQELMYNYLRSLKINNELWITASLAFQESIKHELYWDYDPKVTSEQINETVTNALYRIFPHTIFTVETFIEEWDDEENDEKSVWDEEFESTL